MRTITPPGNLINNTVYFLFFISCKMIFGIFNIQVIHHKHAAIFQRHGYIIDDLIIFKVAFEVTKAGEETEYIMKTVIAKWQSHIVPVKLCTGSVRLLC